MFTKLLSTVVNRQDAEKPSWILPFRGKRRSADLKVSILVLSPLADLKVSATAPRSLQARGLGRLVFRSGLIQRFASRKAFLDSVPISDTRFTELPAEINLFPASQAWKVHQPRLEVLDQAPGLLNLFDRLSQLLGSLIALRLFVVELRERRKRTAQHHNAQRGIGDFLGNAVQGALLLASLLEKLPDHGQKLFGFVAVEIFISHGSTVESQQSKVESRKLRIQQCARSQLSSGACRGAPCWLSTVDSRLSTALQHAVKRHTSPAFSFRVHRNLVHDLSIHQAFQRPAKVLRRNSIHGAAHAHTVVERDNPAVRMLRRQPVHQVYFCAYCPLASRR